MSVGRRIHWDDSLWYVQDTAACGSSHPSSLRCLSVPGVVIVLFFHCVAALFNPAYRKGEPIKWGLVSYTVVIFSFVTIQTTINLYIDSFRYIDNREFPGVEGVFFPGPEGYTDVIYPTALNVTANAMLDLSIWLADCLLVSSSFGAAFTQPGVSR